MVFSICPGASFNGPSDVFKMYPGDFGAIVRGRLSLHPPFLLCLPSWSHLIGKKWVTIMGYFQVKLKWTFLFFSVGEDISSSDFNAKAAPTT